MKQAVIAGSYAEYRDWLAETGNRPQGCVYVSESAQLYGLQDVKIHWVGTWSSRRNCKELMAIASVVGTPATRSPLAKPKRTERCRAS